MVNDPSVAINISGPLRVTSQLCSISKRDKLNRVGDEYVWTVSIGLCISGCVVEKELTAKYWLWSICFGVNPHLRTLSLFEVISTAFP